MCSQVEAHWEPELLRGCPEAFVFRVKIRALGCGVNRDHHAMEAQASDAVKFCDGTLRVLRRHHPHTSEAIGVVRAELRQPCVVGTEACVQKVRLLNTVEDQPHAGVKDLAFDTV